MTSRAADSIEELGELEEHLRQVLAAVAESTARLDDVDASVASAVPAVPAAMVTRRRLLASAAAVVVMGVGASLLWRRSSAPPVVSMPVATMRSVWRQLPPCPIDASEAMAVVLDDDHIAVAGPLANSSEASEFSAAMFTVSTASWTLLPKPSLGPVATAMGANGRLVAVSSRDDETPFAALWEPNAIEWTAIPVPVGTRPFAWSWDGDHLAFLDSGQRPDDPAVRRWSRESATWAPASQAPIEPRTGASAWSSGTRIAVWGGRTVSDTYPAATTDDAALANAAPSGGGAVLTDGAIYDASTDTWIALPPAPELERASRIGAQLLISGDTLVIISGHDETQARQVAVVSAAAAEQLPAPTATGYIVSVSQDVIAVSTVDESGPQPVEFLDTDLLQWRDAPYPTVLRIAGRLVSLSATIDNPTDRALAAAVLADDTWARLDDAPITNRMNPALATVGNTLFLFGGLEGSDLSRTSDAWTLTIE